MVVQLLRLSFHHRREEKTPHTVCCQINFSHLLFIRCTIFTDKNQHEYEIRIKASRFLMKTLCLPPPPVIYFFFVVHKTSEQRFFGAYLTHIKCVPIEWYGSTVTLKHSVFPIFAGFKWHFTKFNFNFNFDVHTYNARQTSSTKIDLQNAIRLVPCETHEIAIT